VTDNRYGFDRYKIPGGAPNAVTDEAWWRQLFNNMAEGFLLGELVRDDRGQVVDWRYLDVNDAWCRLTGLSREQAVGKLGREVMPDVEAVWIAEFAAAVKTDEPQDFKRLDGLLGRWFQGRCFRTAPERFGVFFRDVTAETDHARRQAALIELGEILREASTVPELTRLAADLAGITLGASRTGYGHVDAATETVDIEEGWTAPGIQSIAGVHRFDAYGRLRDGLVHGEPLVINDTRTDPRTADNPDPMLALQIGAMVNMPVRERGRTVGVFIAHKEEPHVWTPDELAFLRKVADRVQVGAARLLAEDQQRLVNSEIAHRLKNQLAIVQAIASQTLRQADDLRSANEALSFRLAALARATDVLMATDWSGAELATLARTALSSHGSLDDRFRLDGPRLRFDPQISLAMALALHELATNAVKYGALSNDVGHVELRWSLSTEPDETEPRFHLQWQEIGGPVVSPPDRRGFGSVMIERSLRAYFRGSITIEYRPEGLEFRIDAPFFGLNLEGD
jgi:two-component sensor histidine kinase